MTNQSHKRFRIWSGIFLIAALGMLALGETVLSGRFGGFGLILYWLACFFFTMLAILMAFLDVSLVQRRAREQQRELLESTLQEIARQKEAMKSRLQPNDE